MTISQFRPPPVPSGLRRRNVLLGLAGSWLQRVLSAFGLLLPVFARTPVFANTESAVTCGLPSHGLAPWMVQRRARLRGALKSGFGVQYWGVTFSAEHLAAAPHGVFIIETAKIGASATGQTGEVFFLADEIRRIGHDGRRPVLGYLNLAKIELYRDYWVDALALAKGRDTLVQGDMPWIGPSLGRDGILARYWTPEWTAVVMDRVDRLFAQGVDGLFLDDVLQYYEYYRGTLQGRAGFAAPGGPTSMVDFAGAMMELVIAVADRARQHDCAKLVIVNNGVFLGRDAGEDPPGSRRQDTFDRYRSAIDGILIESVFASGGDDTTISALHDEFASTGIPVLTIDFADAAQNAPTAETRATIAKRALAEDFTPYIADDAAFNRLYPPTTVARAVSVSP